VIYDGKCNRLQQKEKEEYVCELAVYSAFLSKWEVGLDTIRYDTIEELTWTQKLSVISLNLVHVARKI